MSAWFGLEIMRPPCKDMTDQDATALALRALATQSRLPHLFLTPTLSNNPAGGEVNPNPVMRNSLWLVVLLAGALTASADTVSRGPASGWWAGSSRKNRTRSSSSRRLSAGSKCRAGASNGSSATPLHLTSRSRLRFQGWRSRQVVGHFGGLNGETSQKLEVRFHQR